MSNENFAPEKVDLAPVRMNLEPTSDNLITSYEKDPSQPDGPLINKIAARAIDSSMLQSAADAVSQASSRRETEQAEQLAKPLQEGAITGIPSEISTTTPDPDKFPPISTTTVRPTTTTTTVHRTTTTTPPTTPTTTPPKGSEPATTLPNSY